MNTSADKTQENKSSAAAGMLPKLESSAKSTLPFLDNQPEVVMHKKLQALANNSPQMQQMKAIQGMANGGTVVQRVLSASPAATATGDFVDLVNRIFGGKYLLSTSGGPFSLKTGTSKKPISREATVLYDLLHKIISHTDTTTVDFASKSIQTFIGQFETSQIDISDVEKFGVDVGFEQGPTAASMLVHELEEQFQGQVNAVPMGDNFIGNSGVQDEGNEDDAHWDFAIPMENLAIGGYREGTGPKDYLNDDSGYKQLIKYSYNSGRVVIVEYTVIGENVENVERTIYSSEEAFEASEQYLSQMDDDEVIESKKDDLIAEKAKLDEQLKSLKTKRRETHAKKKLKTIDRYIEELVFRLALIPKELARVQAKLDRMNEPDDDGSELEEGSWSDGAGSSDGDL